MTEGFCQRSDLPEEVYHDLLKNQINLQKTILENPNYYDCSETRKKAIDVNQKILLNLYEKIGQSPRPRPA